MQADETDQTLGQFSNRNWDVLMITQSPHKWWSTHKSAVFGSSSSLPPLVGESGGLVGESVGEADLLADRFNSKRTGESVDLPVVVRVRHCLRLLVGWWARRRICW